MFLNEDLDYLPGGFFSCTAQPPYDLISINRTLLTLSHTQSAEQFASLSGGTLVGMVHEDDRDRIALSLKSGEMLRGSNAEARTFRLHTTDAAIRYVSCYLGSNSDEDVLYGFLADVTVQREEHLDILRRKDLYHDLYRKIRLSEERFRFISSFAGVMLYEYDLSNRESSKFENSLDVLGYTEWEMQQIFAESKTSDCLRFLMTDEDYAAIADFYNRFNESGEAEGELRIRRKDGSYHWFYDKRCLVLSQSGEGSFIRGCLWNADNTHQRITGLVESSERDGVTGLYNKSSGFAAIQGILDAGAQGAAFVLFDIDALRLVNDTLGHEVGDALLHYVGTELVRAFSHGGTVGRFGGDEFFALLPMVGEKSAALRKIKHFLSTLKGPKQLQESVCTLSLSAGIVMTDGEKTVDELLAKASRALNGAKQLGVGQCFVYEAKTACSTELPSAMGAREKQEFIREAQEMIAESAQGNEYLMLSVKIEGLSLFNEWFGARLGDKYVAELSYALSELEAEHGALACYFCEDSFGVLMPRNNSLLGELEGRLVGLSKSLSGTVAFLPAIGVCPIGSGAESARTALMHAEEAAPKAFGKPSGRIVYYKAPSELCITSQKELLLALRDGIKKGEFLPYLRPVKAPDGERILGAEVVSRWVRSDGKILDEESYIDAPVELGLSSLLRRSIWEKLFSRIAQLSEAEQLKLPPLLLSLSYTDLCSMDVCATLDAMLQKCGLSPSDICILLPEADYFKDEDFVGGELARLRRGAYRVLFSDVRLCYAMQRRLKDMPCEGVCVSAEQLLKSGMREGEVQRILEELMPLAEELSLWVILTGVADRTAAERLRAFGVGAMSGELFGAAESVSAFYTLLKKQ